MVHSLIALESTKLTKDELVEFDQVYHELVKNIVGNKGQSDMCKTMEWLETVMYYNVPHGKKVRGLMVPMTLKCLKESPSDEEMKLAYVLGWCIEILQASFLVADDIMDNSETRRGRPCWYKVDNMGVLAFNDSLMLEHIVYEILRIYFNEKSYYCKLVDLFLQTTYKTVLGQSLDTQTGKDRNMEEYTMDRYSTIVKYKTSYYTAYLPIALTLAMEAVSDDNLWGKVECIALDIGHMFQVQDDYLDCFGDEKITGKIGTDIQDCKCSWLFVTAKEKCSKEQYTQLQAIYGINDSEKVAEVKALYELIKIPEDYVKYEEASYKNICNKIKEIRDKIPETVFYNLLDLIYKRAK